MANTFWRSAPVANGNLNPAWREQAVGLAVLLNWLTTGDLEVQGG